MIRLLRRRNASLAEPSPRGGLSGWLCRLYRRMLVLLAVLLLLPVAAIIAFRWLPVPCSSFMLIRQIERWMPESTVPQLHYQWVNLDEMTPLMPLAVIAGEDQRFPDHWGFDFAAINRALADNSKHNRTMRGASTISQQTAKNLFLWGDRSLLRKGVEAVLTLCLEILWPKERILEVYLNIAEFGDGIYGVQAASVHLFATTATRLTRRQVALLAAVLPNPRRFHTDHPTSYLLRRAQWIETNMGRLGGTRYLQQL